MLGHEKLEAYQVAVQYFAFATTLVEALPRGHFARGSALECAAILDACQILKLETEEKIKEGNVLLVRIAAMLTKLARA